MCGLVDYTWGCSCTNFGNGGYGNDGNHEPATERAYPKCYDCTIREQNARITHNSGPYGTVTKQEVWEEAKTRNEKR